VKNISEIKVSDIELGHHLQRRILQEFLHDDERTYSQLLIDGMSGNSFLYHLKALLREKLITKSDAHTYVITPLGKLVLDNLAYDSTRFLLRPAVGVFITAQSKDGRYMLYRSARQPFLGKSGLIFGKAPMGSSYTSVVQWVASRRGLGDVKILRSSPTSIIYRQNGEIISHRTGLSVLVDDCIPTPDRTTTAGTTFWSHLPEGTSTNILPEIELCLPKIGDSLIEIDVELPL
jgi:DNA-binding transcriptional ArsR family regulator